MRSCKHLNKRQGTNRLFEHKFGEVNVPTWRSFHPEEQNVPNDIKEFVKQFRATGDRITDCRAYGGGACVDRGVIMNFVVDGDKQATAIAKLAG